MVDDMNIELDDFNLNMILTTVFNWAYDNDLQLYKNLDYTFEAFRCRNALSSEQQEALRKINILKSHTIIDLLSRAILLADFQDTLKFQHTFIFNNHSTNKGHGTYDWKYSSFDPHPYTCLIPLIGERMAQLKKDGFDDWHKSMDEEKHSHFRFWINNFLTKENFSMRLFVQHTGNTRSFDTFHIGNQDSEVSQLILKYILEHHICPDPHHSKLEVPDYVNPDNYNPRVITSSGRFGGFWYLVYLTAKELQEIYKTQVNKRKLNYIEKAYWAYINASSTDKETKYYLFLN